MYQISLKKSVAVFLYGCIVFFSVSANQIFATQSLREAAFSQAFSLQDDDFKAGVAALDRKDYEKAIIYFSKVLERNPNYRNAYYNRGLAYDNLGMKETALADYDKALQIDPSFSSAYHNRAVIFVSQKKYDLAVEEYTLAIKYDPEAALSYHNRGLTYELLGRNDLAADDFAKEREIKEGKTSAPTTGSNPGSNSGSPKTSAVSWTPVIEMDKQIFPSYFLATATMPILESESPGVIGDAQGMIGIHIVNPKANTRVKLVYEVDSVIRQQEFEATLNEAGKYYQIYPKITWNWDALKRFKKPSPANASFTLYLDGKPVEKKTVVVRIRSINEAVYAYSYLIDENRWANTSWLFAAYVNEDHEWIDQILKEALASRVINSFIGYQGKPEDVIKQVFAVWYVLQRRGVRYSSITNTSGSGVTEKVFSQYVRFLDESINSSQANCVDGTVLIASVLKKLGIKVGLVLIPGHCFLVFDLDGKGNWRGLETTMIGSTDLESYPDAESKVKASIKGFLEAVDVGSKTFGESIVKINQKDPQYKMVELDVARKNGVFPIN